MTDTPVGIRTLGQRAPLPRPDEGPWLWWALIAAWALLPFTVGDALAGALDGRSMAAVDGGSVLAWGLWAIAMVAVVAPLTETLVVARLAAPGALVTAMGAAIAAPDLDVMAIVGLVHGALVVVLAAAPAVGERFAQGSAYGDERRFPLRPPAALWLGPIPLVWTAAAAGLVGPVALAAADLPLAAGVVAVMAVGALALAWRTGLGLARRWVVLVPAGLVVHDPYTLADPVLFHRSLIERFGPAAVDSDGVDLTGGAAGLALELELIDSVPVQMAATGWRRRTAGESGRLRRLVVTPTRPARVLDEAHRRRIPTG